MSAGLLADLRERGLIAQVSDEAGLAAHLESPRVLYCGFDPTAESLHIGNLVPLLTLRRFQMHGHRPILLLGGATGLIGDPSGRSSERNLQDPETVAGWVERIRGQVERFLDFDGNAAARIVNNLDWTASLSVVEFLREIGKHFSVNAMISRDSVRARLQRENEGISYTEFSYMLLQAMDYAHLAEAYGCSLQIGGNDQWGNIVSGMDLVRRKLQRESFALTVPLVTKTDGTKFGKSAGGSIWLDSQRTSPYAFYQFWFNTSDADVGNYLRLFTFLEISELSSLLEQHIAAPERRDAQRRLAREVTRMVHGAEAVDSAERISASLFTGEIGALTEQDLEQLARDGMGCFAVAAVEMGLLDALTHSGLAQSNSAGRKLVSSGGVSLNGSVVTQPEARLDWHDALFGRFYLLRRGKKNWYLLRRT
jgi:tyrosyl-tRNA synthetase